MDILYNVFIPEFSSMQCCPSWALLALLRRLLSASGDSESATDSTTTANRVQKRKRRRLTPHQRRRLRDAQRSRCQACQKRIGTAFHVDHRVPLCRGGSNGDDNLQALCGNCHTQKTYDERVSAKRRRFDEEARRV